MEDKIMEARAEFNKIIDFVNGDAHILEIHTGVFYDDHRAHAKQLI